MNTDKSQTERQVDISADDLPMQCPLSGQEIWIAHHRVFLPITETGEALCPYCGTLYHLTGPVKAHH